MAPVRQPRGFVMAYSGPSTARWRLGTPRGADQAQTARGRFDAESDQPTEIDALHGFLAWASDLEPLGRFDSLLAAAFASSRTP